MKRLLCSLLICAQLISCAGNVSTPPDRTSGDTTTMDFDVDESGNTKVTPRTQEDSNDTLSGGNNEGQPGSSNGGNPGNPPTGGGGDSKPPPKVDIPGFLDGLGKFGGKIGDLLSAGLGAITGDNKRKKKQAENKAKELEGLANEVENLKTEIGKRGKELSDATNNVDSPEFNGDKETQDAINKRGSDHNRDLENTRNSFPGLNTDPENGPDDPAPNPGGVNPAPNKGNEKPPYPTPESEKVRKTRDYIDASRDAVKDNFSGDDRKLREGVLDTADSATDAAEDSYRNGDVSEGDRELDVARQLADLAIGAIPVAGDLYDIANAINGENFITGEPIPPEEGIINAANAIGSLAAGGLWGSVGDVGKAGKVLKNIAKKKAKDAARKAGRDAVDPKKEKEIDDRFDKGEKSNKPDHEYPKDYPTKNTKDYFPKYNSEGDARAHARTQIGKDPIRVGDNKFRSQDGNWQYRANPNDLTGHKPGDTPHVHLERLDPKTGEVLDNYHLTW